MAKPITWQQRGEYLAICQGFTPQEFAAKLDARITAGAGMMPAAVAGAKKPSRSRTSKSPRAGAGN